MPLTKTIEAVAGSCVYCGVEMMQFPPLTLNRATGKQFGFPTTCEPCGEAREREEREGVQAVIAEHFRLKKLARLQASGIAPAYLDGRLTLDTYAGFRILETKQQSLEKQALKKIREWIDKKTEKIGVYLFGQEGLGKSHMAHAAARLIFDAEFDANSDDYKPVVLVLSMESILQDVRATFDGGAGERDADVIGRFGKVPWLFLEDLGAAEKPSDFSCRILFQIIDGRLMNGRRTFITSNYDLDHLVGRLTPADCGAVEARRVVSRLAEMCFDLALRGESYRK